MFYALLPANGSGGIWEEDHDLLDLEQVAVRSRVTGGSPSSCIRHSPSDTRPDEDARASREPLVVYVSSRNHEVGVQPDPRPREWSSDPVPTPKGRRRSGVISASSFTSR
jgi:hypothetical protein